MRIKSPSKIGTMPMGVVTYASKPAVGKKVKLYSIGDDRCNEDKYVKITEVQMDRIGKITYVHSEWI